MTAARPDKPALPDRLLTATEAAELLGVELSTIRQWTYQRRLPVVHPAGGRAARYQDDLATAAERTNAYVAERREGARRIVPLDARRGCEHGQNADSDAVSDEIGKRTQAVTT